MLEDGSRALTALLALADRPTAVLCYNDLAAIGLLAAAARVGLRVPGELSVVGFDNIPLSAYATPPLTTVEQPTGALGRAAVESYLRALVGAPVADVVLRGCLIVRESARPCGEPTHRLLPALAPPLSACQGERGLEELTPKRKIPFNAALPRT